MMLILRRWFNNPSSSDLWHLDAKTSNDVDAKQPNAAQKQRAAIISGVTFVGAVIVSGASSFVADNATIAATAGDNRRDKPRRSFEVVGEPPNNSMFTFSAA